MQVLTLCRSAPALRIGRFPVAPGMSPGEALAEASGFPLDGFEHMDACALTQC